MIFGAPRGNRVGLRWPRDYFTGANANLHSWFLVIWRGAGGDDLMRIRDAPESFRGAHQRGKVNAKILSQFQGLCFRKNQCILEVLI
jgi:hypothetical protein